ncbi:uroporphyrinogen-III C-methyltransferase [Desulfovibrio inopinatus]|uniref:uroporphyrinogen-III C-methyltransferase n=1 Tax=Desulfovibrio inopinatus TaxID=102109 RepID=UPI0003FFD15A|nr:uroporphyrinogen-III C-methyltransferase [Desulfovibrio inopinatus]
MSKVYLLGAGPGDPGLLTIKAKEILEKADVVVYDYLANKAFLRYARPDAEIIYVGKKGGDHTLPQDQINQLLVEKVKAGKVVARLKGGDPYVFGRGAEEAEELLDAGAAFETVPGVTSAVAAPAYAGIPLTHRQYASSVSFITGHEDPTKPDSVHNWESLAKGTSTLVFFMGVKNLPDISQNLITAGMDPTTPAALVRWGTTCRQQTLVADIGSIADAAAAAGMKPPALLVVGHVVSLRDRLAWFEEKPLLGKGIVVTRARQQASGLVATLTELGACVYEFPTIEIAPLSDYGPVRDAIDRLDCYDWIIFTSVNGVKYFFDEMEIMEKDARSLAGKMIAAIGPATANELRARGIRPDFIPEKYVAESVVEGLLALHVAGKRVLIPRALKAREILPNELRRAGADVEVLSVYETTLANQDTDEVLAALKNGEIHYVTFTSSSTVDNFFEKIPTDVLKAAKGTVKLATIGPVTAQTLSRHGFDSDLSPEEFTIPALVQALVNDAS